MFERGDNSVAWGRCGGDLCCILFTETKDSSCWSWPYRGSLPSRCPPKRNNSNRAARVRSNRAQQLVPVFGSQRSSPRQGCPCGALQGGRAYSVLWLDQQSPPSGSPVWLGLVATETPPDGATMVLVDMLKQWFCGDGRRSRGHIIVLVVSDRWYCTSGVSNMQLNEFYFSHARLLSHISSVALFSRPPGCRCCRLMYGSCAWLGATRAVASPPSFLHARVFLLAMYRHQAGAMIHRSGRRCLARRARQRKSRQLYRHRATMRSKAQSVDRIVLSSREGFHRVGGA